MKVAHQRKIFDILQTIKEAQSSSLYGDCQEGAFSLCDFIDLVKGKNTKTVALLVKYCELLFKVNNGEIDGYLLTKQWDEIENSVKIELQPKPEIVFLSYKSSMSDSLESIYFAAKSYTEYDVFWIPIPYYDFENINGKPVAAVRYEGAEFYKNSIECTHWQAYDIKERRPDIIFTFNPYDKSNLVTSVHPNFYCEKLRQFTDTLVYVPYFVSGVGVRKQYCTLPGCIYAHKVILQSEKIRNAYIKNFDEAFGNRFGNPNDKFIALGSPKFDAVLNSKREDYSIPESWKQLINGKKVVLYNTSINAILTGDELYLKKICTVLDFFRKQSSIVLWWRPHPLSMSTYKSMRSELVNVYIQLIEDYKKANYGIFDHTPELHRAICLSDMYYGDGGSVLSLYESTKKPIIYQNVYYPGCEVLDMQISCLFADGQYIWLLDNMYKSLFQYDKSTAKIRFLNKIPALVSSWMFASKDMLKIGKKIFFAPNTLNCFLIYHIDNNSFSEIALDLQVYNTNPKFTHEFITSEYSKFRHMYSYEDFIYFVPFSYPAIVRLHVETYKLEYFNAWVDDNLGGAFHMSELNPFSYTYDSCIYMEKLTISMFNINCLLIFNMETCKYEMNQVGNYSSPWSSICYDGDNFWLASAYELLIVRWNPLSNEIKEYRNFPEGVILEKHHNFQKIRCLNNHLFIFPHYANAVISMDLYTEKMKVETIVNDNYVYQNAYYYTNIFDGKIYALCNNKRTIEVYGNENSDVIISNYEEQIPLYGQDNSETFISTVGQRIFEFIREESL